MDAMRVIKRANESEMDKGNGRGRIGQRDKGVSGGKWRGWMEILVKVRRR